MLAEMLFKQFEGETIYSSANGRDLIKDLTARRSRFKRPLDRLNLTLEPIYAGPKLGACIRMRHIG